MGRWAQRRLAGGGPNLNAGDEMPTLISDPGNGGTIVVSAGINVLPLVIAGPAETRVLPNPLTTVAGTVLIVTVNTVTSTGDCNIQSVIFWRNDQNITFTNTLVGGVNRWVCANPGYDTVLVVPLSATVISVLDQCFLDTTDVKPASDQTDQGSETGNQQLFHDLFMGIALDASAGGETDPIRLAIGGVWPRTCPSEIRTLDQMLGPDENGGGTGLLNTTVDNVSNANAAIGRLARAVPIAGTRCMVDMHQSMTRDGVQTIL